MKKTGKKYKEIFKPIEFPKDEQKHNHIVEWWYFNGNLRTKKTKREVSYMDCLFCVKPDKIDIPFIKNFPFKNIFFSHYLISDKNKFKQKTNPLCLVDKNNFTKPLLWINYDNSCLIEEKVKYNYHIVNDFLDLELKSMKKPLLVNKKGFMDLGTKTTYYYSLTRLETKGIVRIGTDWEEVEGLSWMDHQWAQTPLTAEDQWTWFSIQLENGIDLVCFEYGDKQKTINASIIDKDQKTFYPSKINILPKENRYSSTITKNQYILTYLIEIPELNIFLETSPMRKDQEIIFGSISYWEGGINVKGKMNGKTIKGKGFMELVPNSKNREMIKTISHELKKKSFAANLKDLANFSTKSLYLLNEKINKN